jgi:transposase
MKSFCEPWRPTAASTRPPASSWPSLIKSARTKVRIESWTHPLDPDAKITKMKDGRTHMAHKAEHAVDLETGAVLAVTLSGADEGDTATLPKTVVEAAEQVAVVAADERANERLAARGIEEVVGDKGYHSNEMVTGLAELGMRSYLSEPDRGRRSWKGKQREQRAVYGNRRRIRGRRGKRLLRMRGEKVERSFAHVCETGGMRRTHLRGRENIAKRLLLQVGAFNLSLVMRKRLGAGTPRGLTAAKRAILWLQKAAEGLLAILSTVWSGREFEPAANRRPFRAPLAGLDQSRAA